MPKITKTKEQEKALARTSELLKRLKKINLVLEAAPESGRSERNRESAEIAVVVSGVKVKLPVAVESALDILSDIRKRYCAEVRNSEKKFNIELDEQDRDILVGVSKSGKIKRSMGEDKTEEKKQDDWEEANNNELESQMENPDAADGEAAETW